MIAKQEHHEDAFFGSGRRCRGGPHGSGTRSAFDRRQSACVHPAGQQGGKVFTFTLADALKQGPVVLYFYPAAFTTGCTIEAHEFADAIDQYHALGATVIGVSHDPIDKLQKFSVSECRSKFAVAADTDQTVMKEYDAVLPQHPEYANRTSYVIAPNGTIIYEYTSLDPTQHVSNTLTALRAWKADQAH